MSTCEAMHNCCCPIITYISSYCLFYLLLSYSLNANFFQTMCQDTDLGVSTESGDEDVEAEQDELLLESAGDVIPKFAAAITPDDFSLYFPNILQLMSARTVSTYKQFQFLVS